PAVLPGARLCEGRHQFPRLPRRSELPRQHGHEDPGHRRRSAPPLRRLLARDLSRQRADPYRLARGDPAARRRGGLRVIRPLSIGFSPYPNDTFVFHAMVAGEVVIPGFSVTPWLADLEALHARAFGRDPLAVTKLSVHAFAHVADRYMPLR